MRNFWNDLPKPFFVLAPMEAVTDTVFRHVVKQAAAPDVWFSEFTNATGWAAVGDKAIGGRLIKTDDEQPIVAQLWGADPEAMAKLAQHCAKLGYHGIDLNTGCPDSSAVKAGGGAAMIKNPELTAQMIAAAKTSGLPVSVKTRLGYSRLDERHKWLSFLLQQDIVALTVHLRTKKEMSKVDAHWELMSEIKELRDKVAPQTLLIGNGDVRDREHGLQSVEQTGIDGIMIGRGIFHNPYAFAINNEQLAVNNELTMSHRQLNNELPIANSLSIANRQSLNLLTYHLDLYDTYMDLTHRPYDTLKRFFKIYVRDFAGAAELRDALMHTKDTQEARNVLKSVDNY